jgi:hypothetical protein
MIVVSNEVPCMYTKYFWYSIHFLIFAILVFVLRTSHLLDMYLTT